MKLLTLYIDRRLDYVIDFDCRVDDTDILGQFVVEAGDDDVPLLSFYKIERGGCDNGLILQDNQEKIAYIKDVSATLVSSENDLRTERIQLDIHLTTDKTDYEIKNLDDKHLLFKEDDDRRKWTLTYHRPLRIECTFVTVIIHMYDEGEVRTRNVKLYVSGANKIADVVLDFGSEASQMTIFKRDEAQNVNGITPLFEDMMRLYGGESENCDDYLQYDHSETGLYKSMFFAQKEWTREDGKNSFAPILLGKENNKPILDSKVLVLISKNRKEEIRHTYLNLPNVKIMDFGGVREPSILYDGSSKRISDFKDNYFYRRCINHFIFNALYQISKEEDIPFVSFYLLMPNIYSHNKIFDNLYWISVDIQEMLESFPVIRGVEVSMISESDASLLGTICAMRHEALRDGNYLVLDAGKGTLDFSVLQISSETHLMYRNVYRSGIVGAGNAISYAFLLAILDHFYFLNTGQHPTESDLRDYIYYNVLGMSEGSKANQGGDAFYLKELMEAVDDYKIAVGEKMGVKKEELPLTNNLKSITEIQLSTLVEYVKRLVDNDTYQLLSDEELKYVNKTIQLIVDSVVSKLATMKGKIFTSINDIVFAGRGFEFKPLKESMIHQLLNRGIIAEDTGEIAITRRLCAANPKIICLYLSEVLINGQYNNRMIVVPVVAESRIINEQAFSKRSKGLSWKKFFTFLSKNKSEEKQDMEVDQQTYDFRYFINIICNDIYNPGDDSDKNGMVKGFLTPLSSPRDLLLLGSTSYKPDICLDGEIRLFYGEDKLFLRNELKHEVHELKLGVDLETSSLVFASLFPACNPRSKKEVFIPEIERGTQVSRIEDEILKRTDGDVMSKRTRGIHRDQNEDEALINEIKDMKDSKL